MKYIGLQSQISSNNRKSILLLISFPTLLLGLVWLFFLAVNIFMENDTISFNIDTVNNSFLYSAPYIFIGVLVWFLIAWFSHSSMIRRATGAKPLERKENKRVYNLVENLCISKGIKMPKIHLIEDDSLNAFASGLSDKTFAVTFSRGIINKLEDDELEAVIAHELTHIINRDVRLLIVSIIFVGIFAFITEMAFRSLRFAGRGRGKKEGGALAIVLIVVVLGIIGMILSSFFRFALSRKREYLADAGAAEMTKNPLALASALKKISKDPWIEAVKRDDVAQMFIDHPTKRKDRKLLSTFFNGIFATHPPIKERIQVLEQF
ncbi:M48 family metallopeptidase [Flavobacteriaceae bacterium]|nr:M48 family metallopeptidase [Flavobacteriaceae bacterium]MDC0652058.1 M48 family metallopeptidase [Flavobacteriaceae bacterium]MDC1168532.1 M48 family metallopeptidase [Flavobacteriaceae bacterium]MDC3318139.1 M48 family metallopeptidase [Flavobacteriaceae bacterium]